jgi:hypothetical protein
MVSTRYVLREYRVAGRPARAPSARRYDRTASNRPINAPSM